MDQTSTTTDSKKIDFRALAADAVARSCHPGEFTRRLRALCDAANEARKSGKLSEADNAIGDLMAFQFDEISRLAESLRWACDVNPGAIRDLLTDLLGERLAGIVRDGEILRDRQLALQRSIDELARTIVEHERRFTALEGGRP